MDKATFIGKIEAMLELDPGSLNEGSALAEVEAWDSLAVLSYISLADETLGKVVDAKAIGTCRTVGDLLGLLGNAIQD